VSADKKKTPAKRDMGRRLAYWRARLKLSQAAFAELVGVHYSTVSLWEDGFTSPRPDALRRIIKRLNVGTTEFYSESDPKPKPSQKAAQRAAS
jgi:transcriptional regulator with XRE-family HTH domain